nr:MAG TPA: hypothetical protein [Caudoviricetes sp.]
MINSFHRRLHKDLEINLLKMPMKVLVYIIAVKMVVQNRNMITVKCHNRHGHLMDNSMLQ